MKEAWKDIKGFESVYKISNMGRLKSFKRSKTGYILSFNNSTGDYFNAVLTHKGKTEYHKLHRLVAEYFLDKPKGETVIHHKDGNKQNNRVDNLEWKTPSEHIKLHASLNPALTAGVIRYNRITKPKRIMQYSLDGRLLGAYMNSSDANKATGVCYRNILQVAKHEEYKPGKVRSQAGGYIWKLEGRQ